MPRLPYAAVTLIEQVTAQRKRAKAQPQGDTDGLNVHRSISFDKPTSKWLAPLLTDTTDRRIVGVADDGGRLVITFSPRTIADDRTPFSLDLADPAESTTDAPASGNGD